MFFKNENVSSDETENVITDAKLAEKEVSLFSDEEVKQLYIKMEVPEDLVDEFLKTANSSYQKILMVKHYDSIQMQKVFSEDPSLLTKMFSLWLTPPYELDAKDALKVLASHAFYESYAFKDVIANANVAAAVFTAARVGNFYCYDDAVKAVSLAFNFYAYEGVCVPPQLLTDKVLLDGALHCLKMAADLKNSDIMLRYMQFCLRLFHPPVKGSETWAAFNEFLNKEANGFIFVKRRGDTDRAWAAYSDFAIWLDPSLNSVNLSNVSSGFISFLEDRIKPSSVDSFISRSAYSVQVALLKFKLQTSTGEEFKDFFKELEIRLKKSSLWSVENIFRELTRVCTVNELLSVFSLLSVKAHREIMAIGVSSAVDSGCEDKIGFLLHADFSGMNFFSRPLDAKLTHLIESEMNNPKLMETFDSLKVDYNGSLNSLFETCRKI